MIFFNTKKGTVLITTLILFIVLSGLSTSFLMVTGANYKKIKSDDLKLRSYNIAMSGIHSSIVRLRAMASEKNEPTYTDAQGLTVESSGSWTSLPEFSIDNWKRYPNFYSKDFGGGNFKVDLYINEDDTTYCLWSKGSYNTISTDLLSFYKANANTSGIPGRVGAVSVQCDPNDMVSGSNGIYLSFNGNPTITGYDHKENGTDQTIDPQNTFALTTNLDIKFVSTSPINNYVSGTTPDPTDNISALSAPSGTTAATSQKTAFVSMEELFQAIIDKARASADYNWTNLAKPNGKITIAGNNYYGNPGSDNYKITYVDLGSDKQLHISGTVQGYGILVIETDAGHSGIVDITGTMDWHGLVLLNVKGDATNSTLGNNGNPKSGLSFSRGTPQFIGTFGFYFSDDYKFDANNKLIHMAGNPDIKWSNEAWENVKKQISKFYGTKTFSLSAWKSRG